MEQRKKDLLTITAIGYIRTLMNPNRDLTDEEIEKETRIADELELESRESLSEDFEELYSEIIKNLEVGSDD